MTGPDTQPLPGKCPDCKTVILTCGRDVCQACGMLRILYAGPRGPAAA